MHSFLSPFVFIVLAHAFTDEAKVAAAQLNYQQRHDDCCKYLFLAPSKYFYNIEFRALIGDVICSNLATSAILEWFALQFKIIPKITIWSVEKAWCELIVICNN